MTYDNQTIESRLLELPAKTLIKKINDAVNLYELGDGWCIRGRAARMPVDSLVAHLEDLCSSRCVMVSDDLEIVLLEV